MPLIQLAKSRWQDFFDAASRALGTQTTKVELTGVGLGDRIAADWVPLAGMSYEPADDTLTLFIEGLEHRIRHPRTIHIDENVDTVRSFEAIDEDGVHHIVQFSTAIELRAR